MRLQAIRVLELLVVTAPANAPPASTAVFRHLLGEIIGPSATRTSDGGLQFSNPEIAEFYQEILRQFGAKVLPEKLRP